jgi:DNA polymerase-3 subunit delta'
VSAANALLKTLEEPSANTVMVLVSDEPARLPATIRSRCQRVDARFPPRAQALAWLSERGVGPGEAAAALDLAAGNPGLALELAQPAQRELIEDSAGGLTGLLSGKQPLVEIAARWAREETAPARLAVIAQLARLLGWRREGISAGGSAAIDRLARLTAQADFSKLWTIWERANRARREIGGPLRPELLWVEVLQSWTELVPR